MKKILLIINPNSGKGLGRYHLPKIIKFFKKHKIELDVFQTQKPRQATIKTKQNKNKYKTIIAAGGDGTINEVLNGIIGGKASLAIIPLGTANVLASQFDIPSNVEQACNIIIKNKTKKVDLGKTNNHYFLQSCGIGFDGHVISQVNLDYKQQTGKLLFYLNIFKSLFNYSFPKLRITVDKKVTNGYTAIIMNSKYYGGKIIMAKNAKINDGLLDIIVFEKPSALLMFQVVFSGIFFNKLLDFDDISVYQGKNIKVESIGRKSYVQTDGELIGKTPIKIKVLPKHLKVIY